MFSNYIFWWTAFKVQRSKARQCQRVWCFIQWHNFDVFVQTKFRNMIKNWRASACLFFSEALKLSYAKATTDDLAEASVFIKHRYSNKKINRHLSCCLAFSFLVVRKAFLATQFFEVTCETFSVIILISGLRKMLAIRLQFGQYYNWLVIDIDETVQIIFRSFLLIRWTIPGE